MRLYKFSWNMLIFPYSFVCKFLLITEKFLINYYYYSQIIILNFLNYYSRSNSDITFRYKFCDCAELLIVYCISIIWIKISFCVISEKRKKTHISYTYKYLDQQNPFQFSVFLLFSTENITISSSKPFEESQLKKYSFPYIRHISKKISYSTSVFTCGHCSILQN